MAHYRKNKKRFDPRYFMNEKMEEPIVEEPQERVQIPLYDDYDDAKQKEYLRQKKAAADRARDEKDVPRGSTDVSFELREDLSHLADPATWNILALAAGKMFSIWAPVFGIAGFVAVIRDALEFLKDNPKPGAQEAEDAILAASKAKSKDGGEEWPEDDRDLLAMQYDADDTQQAWRDSIEEKKRSK